MLTKVKTLWNQWRVQRLFFKRHGGPEQLIRHAKRFNIDPQQDNSFDTLRRQTNFVQVKKAIDQIEYKIITNNAPDNQTALITDIIDSLTDLETVLVIKTVHKQGYTVTTSLNPETLTVDWSIQW